jgi:hypothetical protein
MRKLLMAISVALALAGSAMAGQMKQEASRPGYYAPAEGPPASPVIPAFAGNRAILLTIVSALSK